MDRLTKHSAVVYVGTSVAVKETSVANIAVGWHQQEGLLRLIRSLLPDLHPAERLVGEAILADPGASAGMSITELAKTCGVSATTIVRFCRHAGFTGYRGFRMALVATVARNDDDRGHEWGDDIEPDDPIEGVVAKMGHSEARAIEDTARQLNTAVLGTVVDAIVAARMIDVFGIGASALVAEDLQQKLRRVGRVVFASRDTHTALASAALLGTGDVAIAISYSGATFDTVDWLREAAQRGATTVAVTNAPRSPLARIASHVLTTASRDMRFRSGAMASRMAQLMLVDCLFVAVVQRTYPESLAALENTYNAIRDRRGGAHKRGHRAREASGPVAS